MLQGEVDTTGTGCRGVQWLPAIPDGNGISDESSPVEGESKFLQREGREPARGSFFLGKVYCTLCRSIDSIALRVAARSFCAWSGRVVSGPAGQRVQLSSGAMARVYVPSASAHLTRRSLGTTVVRITRKASRVSRLLVRRIRDARARGA